ncbi:hypothetical protein HAX54_041772 [Datura stramonium]|uniref:Conserved oligomeric Golgi complex subunit 5 helical domain-containing protein n=1 Tax=Datura stramonium TaxID=4076 RepID=A0ABS8W292_DATST|nr:hypothetical protein [Datura stramonium]
MGELRGNCDVSRGIQMIEEYNYGFGYESYFCWWRIWAGRGAEEVGHSVWAKQRRRGCIVAKDEGCMDQLHSIVVAVWHLQRVLSKKRDSLRMSCCLMRSCRWNVFLVDMNCFEEVILYDAFLIEDDPILTDRVWEALVKSFANQMKSTFSTSSFVKEIFTLGYPKLFYVRKPA